MSEYISVEDSGHVRYLVLDRPDKRNAINRAMVLELSEASREAAEDTDVRVIVVRGEGPAFSAGIDVGELASFGDPALLRPFRRHCVEMVNLLEEMPKAVIAQIHGPCLGLGAELALACDIRVMADDARFGLPE